MPSNGALNLQLEAGTRQMLDQGWRGIRRSCRHLNGRDGERAAY